MSGGVLAGLEYSSPDMSLVQGMPSIGMDKEAMLERLRNSPKIALELLATGDSPIIYMGNHAKSKNHEGRTLGVRFTDGGGFVEGDNLYGRFLQDVRSAYLEELAKSEVHEKPVQEGQVIVDFVPSNSNRSHIEALEEDGERFIHVDTYKPVNYRMNSAKDGTTGYSQRESEKGVSFQTFVCPFGTDSRSRIRVASCAEASFLYEQALRQELDWKAMFSNLQKRGLRKPLTKHESELIINDMRAQFSWIREQIIKDNDRLQNLTIVAETHLVTDNSMGRSVYDPQNAPSPAHVLARYINNPEIFFSSSENGVLKALSAVDKNEPYRFSAVNGAGEVTIIVDGSDTIGGRSAGTRAVKEKRPVYRRDSRGKIMYDRYGDPIVDTTVDTYKLAFKPNEEIEADYKSFSQRLDNIIANISEDVKIRFLSSKGVGTPQMLQRYVQEHSGTVKEWDYLTRQSLDVPYEAMEGTEAKRSFELLRVPGFSTVLPVLLKQQNSVDFTLEVEGQEHDVTFHWSDMPASSGLLTFSDVEDARFRTVIDRAGLAANAGLPVIHVMNNASEAEQKQTLDLGSSLSRSQLIGETDFAESLFAGELKDNWELQDNNVFYFMDRGSNLAMPSVAYLQNSAVYVNNIPFHSVYSAYAALLLKSRENVPESAFVELSQNEVIMDYVSKVVGDNNPDDISERCMRNAVHMMAQASSSFADRLLSSGDMEIVMPSTHGNKQDFVDLDGNGQNRFGVVLMAERDSLMRELEDIRLKAEESARRIAEENSRLQKRANTKRAQGEKHRGGLPASIEESSDAIWLVGTNRPARLSLPDDQVSFIHWEEREYGRDALNRELASRMRLDDGEGNLVDNKYIFLFPTDQMAVMGTRHVKNNPDSKDLTGVTRLDPATGQAFTCAFGIPVKKDNFYYERDNKLGRPCSFRMDNESSDFSNSIINADALARSAALRHGMSLCYSIRERPMANGEENDDLSRVFNDKIWDYPRTKEIIDRRTGKTVSEAGAIMPVEVTRREYNKESHRYEEVKSERIMKTWIDNPHAAPRNKSIVRRYQAVLKEGASLPLNCICLPLTDYSNVPEEKFLADFSFTLSLVNATAIATGKPMRFPLDKDGRLMLGPDIPERYRDMAERKLDSFIGVVKEENIINGPLPYVKRIAISDAFKKDLPLKADGSDLYLRPNDLMVTFGPFEFNKYSAGPVNPIHEMAFSLEDGTVFKVTGNRFTHNVSNRDRNAYYRYDKNDEIRFSVKSSNPERIPEFVDTLKSYVERARNVGTEYRLISEEDAVKVFEARKAVLMKSGYSEEQAIESAGPLGIDGFVNLLSSNSDSIASHEGDVAARSAETMVELENDGRIDERGNLNNDVYHGKEDARDGFKGYVEYKYILPNGTESAWRIVRDTELAIDLVTSKVKRVYRTDSREMPSAKVLDAKLRSYAVQDAGDVFRSITQNIVRKDIDTKEVGSVDTFIDEPERSAQESRKGGNVYVTYYGSRSVPKDAFKVRMSFTCPPGMEKDMDVNFKSAYPDYKTMVGPHKNKVIDDAEYTRRYTESVLLPNKEKILESVEKMRQMAMEDGQDVYVYCYCKPGEFCHRYLINNFLNENGIECQEVPGDRRQYEIGRVPLFGEDIQPLSDISLSEESAIDENDILVFTRSEGQYSQRTYENANADDVTFTLAFATDFTTQGERCTQKAAGSSCISIDLPLKDGRLDISEKAIRESVAEICECLPSEYLKGESCGFNIAGNGIYTLKKSGVTQDDLDYYISAVLAGLVSEGVKVASLRSGGQTGVDESAAAAGHVLGVKTIIHAPANWAFRGMNGQDVKNDESAFRGRFETKDYAAIKKSVYKTMTKGQKKSNELKRN